MKTICTIILINLFTAGWAAAQSGLVSIRSSHDVVTTANGAEALEHYREHAGDVAMVLLDLVMPVMDGTTCFHEIRKIDPAARVVLVTGYSLSEATQSLLDAGALELLRKPFDTRALVRTVERLIA